MAIKTTSCPGCGYPLAAPYGGQTAICANCGANLIAQGVTIPNGVVIGVLCFLGGMFLGPSIVASTSSGKRWLEEQARRGG